MRVNLRKVVNAYKKQGKKADVIVPEIASDRYLFKKCQEKRAYRNFEKNKNNHAMIYYLLGKGDLIAKKFDGINLLAYRLPVEKLKDVPAANIIA